ncbi:aminopeptidase [Deinococcus arenicola]|uniref:Aminopeptidase n=1 Tax=Deinococcus arenicola TaxID=2994950 RepID=A0ABU4DP72_9DEIO|nr:aminopeptidase [Deinococcus sp. ZS9-10]MDV6374230.1 aminopeptidase [Deinococcus sp. ZS9-10]
MPLTFDEKLQNYARLAVRVGLGLREGQRVLIQAPVDTAPLARAVVREAYAAGASFVDVRWDDDDVQLARFQLAPDGTFDTLSRWRVDAEIETANAGGAVLAIRATNPNLLGDVDAVRVSTHQKALAAYRKPYTEQVMTNRLNWNLISAPIPAWAEVMFPDASADEAMDKQWDAIFAATRADQPDPMQAWQEHLANLKRRREVLNAKQFSALHFRGGETDLTVGLADGHIWGGGAADTPGGITFTANIPTEEVWTAPHRERVDGMVVGTKPLSYSGTLLDGIRITFKDGRITEATASKGQATLDRMIDTDEGSHRLGEVALVPHSSPISKSGLLFLNTLYDENAASHIAIGSAYRNNVAGGVDMNVEDFNAKGGNDSLTHVDWMIGSNEMDVDGILKDGSREPVMRAGEFVI